MSDVMEDTAATIRRLNDQFRTTLKGGNLFFTPGVIDRKDIAQVIAKVVSFADFNDANDPHKEHDFGGFEVDGDTLFWKICYYDASLKFGSPDPANPSVTTRVLTVMLASEY